MERKIDVDLGEVRRDIDQGSRETNFHRYSKVMFPAEISESGGVDSEYNREFIGYIYKGNAVVPVTHPIEIRDAPQTIVESSDGCQSRTKKDIVKGWTAIVKSKECVLLDTPYRKLIRGIGFPDVQDGIKELYKNSGMKEESIRKRVMDLYGRAFGELVNVRKGQIIKITRDITEVYEPETENLPYEGIVPEIKDPTYSNREEDNNVVLEDADDEMKGDYYTVDWVDSIVSTVSYNLGYKGEIKVPILYGRGMKSNTDEEMPEELHRVFDSMISAPRKGDLKNISMLISEKEYVGYSKGRLDTFLKLKKALIETVPLIEEGIAVVLNRVCEDIIRQYSYSKVFPENFPVHPLKLDSLREYMVERVIELAGKDILKKASILKIMRKTVSDLKGVEIKRPLERIKDKDDKKDIVVPLGKIQEDVPAPRTDIQSETNLENILKDNKYIWNYFKEVYGDSPDKIIKEGKTSKLRSPQRDLYEKLIQNIQIFLLPSMKSLRELRDKERERREKTNREEYLEKLVNTNPLQFIIGEVEVDENKEVEVYDDGYMEDDRNLAFN